MLEERNTAGTVIRQLFPHVADATRRDIVAVSGGFSGASVFRVGDSHVCYSLRRWPARQTHPERILAIHQLLTIAHGSGVDVVPVPIQSGNGSALPEYDGAFWQLEPWMPGRADYYSSQNDERMRSAMMQVAGFHNAIRNWIPPVDVRRWFQPPTLAPSPTVANRVQMIESYVNGLDEFAGRLAHERDDRFRELGNRLVGHFRLANGSVLNELRSVIDVPVPVQPCIRDLWHDHLLFTNDMLTGIIDFGAMATDSVACDLSRMLGSLLGDDRLGWQRAVSHYETVRPLTESEHRLLQPLDRSSVLLSGMTWLKRRYILRNTTDDLSPVCERMESIAERLTTLVDNLSP